MQFWLSAIDRMHKPLYLAIADAIGRAVEARDIKPGETLPPQRQLARALDVDLTTVTRGYAEARRRGLVEAAVGRGTFVRNADWPPYSPGSLAPLIDLSMNPPPQSQDPTLRELLRTGFEKMLGEADMAALMGYHLGGGSPWARAAGADWVRALLPAADADRTLVCNGGQSAIMALLTLLTRPGELILTEPLTYQRFRAAATHLGLRLAFVAADADGILPDALEEACTTQAPKALYCIPTMHNPTAATMTPARRAAIAEVVLRYRLPVIEDDAYGQLPSKPIEPLAALAPACGWYISTLSKCLSPGLRLAYVVAPDREQANRLETALRATTLMPNLLMTVLVTSWIQQGTASALRDGVRREIVARQAIARSVLPNDAFTAHPEAPHLWLTLPSGWHRMTFIGHVRSLGLALTPSDPFAVQQPAPNAVRIGLGAAGSQTELRAALQSVATVLRNEAPPGLSDIV